MKLTTTKLRYQKRNSLPNILVVLFLLLFPVLCSAQQYNFSFHQTPVSTALLEVSNKTNIRISFDADNLEQFSIDGSLETDSVSAVLDWILDGTGYRAEFKYNTWLIYKPGEDEQKTGTC